MTNQAAIDELRRDLDREATAYAAIIAEKVRQLTRAYAGPAIAKGRLMERLVGELLIAEQGGDGPAS